MSKLFAFKLKAETVILVSREAATSQIEWYHKYDEFLSVKASLSNPSRIGSLNLELLKLYLLMATPVLIYVSGCDYWDGSCTISSPSSVTNISIFCKRERFLNSSGASLLSLTIISRDVAGS